MAEWYIPAPPQHSGAVGMPTFIGADAQPVPDPSPGVNSVLFAVPPATKGTFGPTPPPEDRWPVPTH